MTASAAGSGGAVCPSTAAVGAVITCATAAPAAGSGVRCARKLLRLVQSLLVLRLRCLLELVVRLLPLLCLALCSVRGISSLVGVGVARPVVGSTGETWLRWQFPSPVASSRRPGSSTGLPRFSRFWTRFSSAHFWSLLHWRRLSVVLPAAMVDCCLSSLRAGVCSLPWRWRISARVLMVACFPLLQGRRSAPSPIPWPILDLTLVFSRCKNLAWLVLDTVIPVVPPPCLGHFSVPPVVTVFTLSDAWNLHGIENGFLFLALQVSPCEPGGAVLTCFLLVGMVASTCGGIGDASRSTASSGGFSPMQAPGCRVTWSPRLLLLELLPPSGSGCGCFRCLSCSFHPAPAWFPRRLRLRGC